MEKASDNLMTHEFIFNMKKTGLYTMLMTSVLIVFSGTVNGEIYKWVDEQGKAHFTDRPPNDRKVEEVELKINTYTSVEITPLVERLGKKGKVVMYSAVWCGICTKAKGYFQKNNIPYVSYDVEKSRIGKMDFKLLRGRSVPVIIVGRKRMNGFTVSRFDKLYKDQMKNDAFKDEI